MKKVIIAIVVAVVVIAAAGAGYIYVKKEKEKSNAQNQSQFNPESTDGKALTATITVTPKKGSKSVTVMKTDGQGASEYTVNNGASRMVFTRDFYYACAKNSCSKIPSDADQGFVADPKVYDLSQADINNAQKNAQQQPQQPCPTGDGTCDVWKTSSFSEDASVATVYVNTESRRVVQVDIAGPEDSKTKIMYDYGDVSVKIPENARQIEFNIPSVELE